MINDNFLERLASGLGQSATIKNVMGEPIHEHNKTIVPVARIAYGFGGGYGEGRKGKPVQQLQKEAAGTQVPSGEGAGGGGGLRASLTGVFEITPTSTRFIPANPGRYIAIGFVAGFMLKFLFGERKNR